MYGKDDDFEGPGIKDHMIFPDLIAQQDLSAFYNPGCLYRFPTIIEAFPIPAIGAMVCGCTIVTSNSTAIEELTDGVSRAVKPTDTDAITGAMKQVPNGPVLQQQMRKKWHERLKIFSWEKCERETMQYSRAW